jgi:uncharacterized protein YraI
MKIMTFVQGFTRGKTLIALVALLAASLVTLSPVKAAAARPNGYPVTNVNLRAGPGTYYPAIVVVPARSWISIRGCLADYAWCEVIAAGNRGWMRSIYLQGWYQNHYYSLGDYAPRLGYPVVAFDVKPYWDQHYRDRPFYGERARWGGSYGEGWTNRSSFYGRLQPYGNWIWLQGQYVWVPGDVGPRWRPYTVGRWAYTQRYGWMWVSNEPFGWATYHYGRWGFSNRVGWFWVPGNRWGPAWVSWRSSNDYLAWAPLPPTPDEGGLSINISVGNVPDYYWQVVPNRDFLAPDLPRYIVRDRDRYDPILAGTRPLGNVTVVNNTVVNNVVNVTYVEQKTQKKVVVYKVEKTKDEAKVKGGKFKGDAIEVFEPAPEAKPKVAAPTETKPIEKVAAESETKQQGGGAPTTEELLVPAEVKKPLEAEAKPPAPPPPAPKAGEGAAEPAKEEAAPPPPPPPPAATEEKTPPPSEGAAPPPAEGETPPAPPPSGEAPPEAPPPAKEETAPPAKEETPPPPPAEEAAPPPAETIAPPPAKEETPPPPPPAEEKAPPPPPQEKAPPPPPAEDAAPPPPAETIAPPPPAEEKAPPPPPPAEEKAPPPPPPAEETAPPPPPPAEETAPPPPPPAEKKKAPPPPPAEETAPPPPPPAEEAAPPPPPPMGEGPKPKKRKNQAEQPFDDGAPSFAPPPPPPEDQAPPPSSRDSYQGDMAPPSSQGGGDDGQRRERDGKPKKKKDRGCPEGMVTLDDGSCAPSR